ncbi:MAG TPA: DUF86 domain-containing protein [Sedimentisphaerales bacterium]|nr:DUF86 domain-containing protein [Sedimentisphaerales bacterium]HNU27988.1 DUF86 domain-containing protein [Sedimentisphaerales bacterium]
MDDQTRLGHMCDAAREAMEMARGQTRGDLDTDRKLCLSLVHLLEIIGEAAKGVSPEFRRKHPDLPWKKIAGLRDRLIHGYFDVNLDIVWQTVTEDLPHFPSARQFEDPFEGAVAVLAHDFPTDPRYPDLDYPDRAFEELRRLTKINCWHCADYESAAMWKLYASNRMGVAVRTSAERLRTALQPFRLAPRFGEEEPYWGRVRYVDLHTERLRVGMEHRFFYKHRAFEWEREFRVVISLRMAEEWAVPVPADGIDVPFDPDRQTD